MMQTDFHAIVFVGLGNMGLPMATNLARKDSKNEGAYPHPLRVIGVDIDPQRASMAANQGVEMADGFAQAMEWLVADAAEQGRVPVVMTSLPTPVHVENLGFRDDLSNTGATIAKMLPAGGIWIDFSTSTLQSGQELGRVMGEAGIHFVDCPITGGIDGAIAGTLRLMAGGDAGVVDRVRPILGKIGSKTYYLGGAGAGYVAKLAQVMLCYLNSQALTEALTLGVSGGTDVEVMLEIIQNSTGQSYVAEQYGPMILDRSFDPSFALGIALKDLVSAQQLATHNGLELPVTALVAGIYEKAVATYGADVPHLEAMRVLEETNGITLAS